MMASVLVAGGNVANAEPRATPPTSARGGLAIDGAPAGWIVAVDGGHATSDVVTEKSPTAHKHLAGVKYEDITIHTGSSMSKGFYDWIKTSLSQSPTRKSGTVGVLDTNMKMRAVREFTNALVTEIGFPALDAGSKDAAPLAIKLAPELVRAKTIDDKWHASFVAGANKLDSKLAPSTFRFDYPGCGEACKAATKISAVTIKLGAAGRAGAHRVTSIVVTMPPPPDLLKWSAEGGSRDGVLEYRAVDGSVFVALKLRQMKPVRVTVQAQATRPLVELELQASSVEAS
jgi:phage tail-like protein